MFSRFLLVIVLTISLIGCGQAYYFQFYRPEPVSDKITSTDWGFGTVFRTDNVCVWLVQGNTADAKPVAVTFMAVIPIIPRIQVDETDVKRNSSAFIDFWVTLIPDNPAALIPDNTPDPYIFDVGRTAVRFDNGESTGPALMQLSKIFSWPNGNLDVQHEPDTKVTPSRQVTLDWEVVRLHLLFVKPSETAKPVSITLNGIARRGQPASSVEFRLREESNSYVPAILVRQPSYHPPRKLCKELAQPNAKLTPTSKEAVQ